jgi:hypothetical protein
MPAPTPAAAPISIPVSMPVLTPPVSSNINQNSLISLLSSISNTLSLITNSLSSNKNYASVTPNNQTTSNNPFIINSSNALEGFDLLGLEDNMKKGKQSNTIRIGSQSRYSGKVMPYDGSTFYN